MPRGVARIPQPREWLLKKRCPRCRQTKAWALFSPDGYWPDGSVRSVQSHCRACDAKRKNDPVARAEYHDRNREQMRAYWRKRQRRVRAAVRRDRLTAGERLPVGPFNAWLDRVVQEEGGLVRLARDAGLHRDTLAHTRSRSKYVTVTTAEAALCARGKRLDDLYDDEAVVA